MDKVKSAGIAEKTAGDRDGKGRFIKGNPHAFQPGKSGNPNGMSKEAGQVKRDILSCFELEKFQEWAKEHLTEFYSMIIKLLPKELHSTGTPGITIIIDNKQAEDKKEANNRLLEELN